MCDEMAIPFNLPTDEQTEDNYRRLDQLLVDLYSVLRQILIRPRCVSLATPDDSRGTAPGGDVMGSRRGTGDLPDLVSSTLSVPVPACQCTCSRRRPRQRRRQTRRCCPEVPLDTARVEDSWLVVGDQLKKIAEELRATFIKKQEESEKPQPLPEPQPELKMEVKSSGLFSLLVPTQFRSSIWTTVFLLVGWRLLARAR